MAEISVIVPIHNTREYLEQCIDSIINQTFKDLEIILVDDASTDGSEILCDEYARKDERIKVLHKKWGGPVAARKAGLKEAHGEYVGFVDSDDWIEPGYYEYMYDIIREYHTYMVETAIIDTAETYTKIRTSCFTQGLYKDDVFFDNIIPKLLYTGDFFESGITPYVWNKLFVRSKLEKYYMRIEDGCDMAEDAACTYPYVISEQNIYISKKAFYHYRVRPTSMKRSVNPNILKIIDSNLMCIKKAINESKLKNELGLQYCYYDLWLHMLCTPWVFDTERLLEVCGSVDKDEKVILYGAGTFGIRVYHYLSEHDVNVIDWVDGMYEELGKTMPVHNPKKADYQTADKVVITVLKCNAVREIRNTLTDMGVDEEKIRWIDEGRARKFI